MPWEQLKIIVQEHPYPLLFATVSGAHLYGFPSPDSDYDLRGAHILPLPEVIGLSEGKETIESNREREALQIDLVTHDVKKFFRLLLKKNGYVLEQLYSPLIVHTTPEHEELKAIAQNCVTRFHAYHYLGFSKSEWGNFEREQPQKVKTLLYVFRVLLTGIHLMRTGEVEANLKNLNEVFHLSYLPELIERKVGGVEGVELDDVKIGFFHAEYERLRGELELAMESSHLPHRATADVALHDLLIRVRLEEK
jgi:predicted nucleotidyltransferase